MFFENTVSKLFITAQTFRVSSIFDTAPVNFCRRTKCLGALERYLKRPTNMQVEKSQFLSDLTWTIQ
jgi:hypothetical protein